MDKQKQMNEFEKYFILSYIPSLWLSFIIIIIVYTLQNRVTLQSRKESSVKTLRSPLTVKFWRQYLLSGENLRRFASTSAKKWKYTFK